MNLNALGMQFAHERRDKRDHIAFAQRLLSQCGRRFRLIKPLRHGQRIEVRGRAVLILIKPPSDDRA